jgi:exosortase/archaeosortase family protein
MAKRKATRRERRRKAPKKPGIGGFVRENGQILLFLLVFAIAATVLLSLLRTGFAEKRVAFPLARATSICVRGVLNLFGTGAELDSTNALRSRGFGFRIIDWCTAINEMAIWFAAVIGFPTAVRRRLLAVVSGWAAIFVLNIVRIAILFFVGLHLHTLFVEAHSYIAQIAFIVVIFAGYLVWAERALTGRSSWGRVVVRTVVVFFVVFVVIMLGWLRILAPYGNALAAGGNGMFALLEQPRTTDCVLYVPERVESKDVLSESRQFPIVKAMYREPIPIGGRLTNVRIEGIDTLQISVNMVTVLALIVALPMLTWRRRLLALGIGAAAIYLYHMFMLYALVRWGYGKFYTSQYGVLPPQIPIPAGIESAKATWWWVRDLSEKWKHIVPFVVALGLWAWLRTRPAPTKADTAG